MKISFEIKDQYQCLCCLALVPGGYISLTKPRPQGVVSLGLCLLAGPSLLLGA